MTTTFVKDPDATLDYQFDWTSWLATGETISGFSLVLSGVTQASPSPSETDGKVTVWLSGGTAGSTGTVECEIETNGGRTDQRTIRIAVRER